MARRLPLLPTIKAAPHTGPLLRVARAEELKTRRVLAQAISPALLDKIFASTEDLPGIFG
jgi:hypothetical protein